MTDEGMTNEKAIKIFNTVLLFGKCDCPKEEIEECLRIAIKALEQEPCEDAISRQAVLDIAKTSKSNWIDNSVLFKKVNNLPPVTPQPKTDTWSIKEVADALEKHGLIKEQEPCDDAISRQALYEWLDGWKEKNKYYHPHTKNEIIPICEVIDIIQSLPPVTPKEKTGHNCNKDYADCDQFVCSECGIELQDWDKVVRDDEYDDISYQEYAFRFCPSCGCEIKEVDE